MNGLSVGSIVCCRNREWIMLPSPDETPVFLRPLISSQFSLKNWICGKKIDKRSTLKLTAAYSAPNL
jgi:hypothetical protein